MITESEYLKCTNPAELIGGNDDFALFQNVSKRRKIRLWIAACLEAHPPPYDLSWSPDDTYALWREGKEDDEERRDPRHLYDFARYWSKADEPWETPEMLPERAALWREVMGPYRAVVLPVTETKCSLCGGDGIDIDNAIHTSMVDPRCGRCGGAGKIITPCPWLTHNDGCVAKLAEAIYQGRRWEAMPILADELESAGCGGERCQKCHGSGTYTVQVRNAALSAANGYGGATTYREWRGCRHCGGDYDRKGLGLIPHPIISHLRGPGPHCRGCFALDTLRGAS